MSREVLQQALAVLKGCLKHPDAQDSIIAIEHELDQPDAEAHLQAVADFGQVQAQPEQEPVAWECLAGGLKKLIDKQYKRQRPSIQQHYTQIPPKRQPLTEEVLYEMLYEKDWIQFARAIEAAHGIGDKA